MAEINKRQGGEVERTGGKDEVKKTQTKKRFTHKMFFGAVEIYHLLFVIEC